MRLALRNTTFTRNYLHSVLNSMTDAVFVTAPGGVVRIANDAACRLTGYGDDELIGKNLVTLLDQGDKLGDDALQMAREPARRCCVRAPARPSRYRSSVPPSPPRIRSSKARSTLRATSPSASAPSGGSATWRATTR